MTPAGALSTLLIIGIFAVVIWVVVRQSRLSLAVDRAIRLADIDNMSGVQFEHYVCRLLRHRGFAANVTKASGDLGIDIVASSANKKIAVQVKRHTGGVSRRAISDAVAGKFHYGCEEAMVVTNRYYTRGARALAASTGCQLIDRLQLAEWILEFQNTSAPTKAVPVNEQELGTGVIDRVADSAPAWLASVIVHAIFLLLVGLVAVQVHRQETSEMAVELAESPEDFENQKWAETLGQQLENPTPGINDPALAADLDSSYSMSDLPAVEDPLAAPKPSLNASAEGWDVFSDVEAPSIGMALTGRQKGRKEALLLAYGGTKSTQDAVNLALAWIARNQGKDGLWSLRGPYPNASGTENKLAATAMALLAFLGDGHTHLEQDQFRQNVHRGLKALLKLQGDEGEFVVEGIPMHHRLYTHAQCTIVLCELYGLTKDSMIREPAQKAVDYCVKIQAPEGGWRYFPYEDADTSVTGWFVMALQSARMAELTVPTPCLKKAGKFLDAVASHGGSRYAYQAGRVESHVMTAEALLCRQYLGWPRDDRRLQQGVAHISRTPVDFSSPNVYYWYYATQVMHHMGGQRWVDWNRVMRQAIPENQEHQGKERGSWNPSDDEWGRTTGRLYMTCLSTYMLEVYYRHLPLYSMEVEGASPPPKNPETTETAQTD